METQSSLLPRVGLEKRNKNRVLIKGKGQRSSSHSVLPLSPSLLVDLRILLDNKSKSTGLKQHAIKPRDLTVNCGRKTNGSKVRKGRLTSDDAVLRYIAPGSENSVNINEC